MAPSPLPFKRLPYLHRYQMWAPKLGRQITLASRWSVGLWATLEADPTVSAYCERPALVEAEEGSRLIDFWVRRGPQEQWLVLEPYDDVDVEAEASAPPQRLAMATVEIIRRQALEQQRVWIENWLSILPYLASHAPYVDAELGDAIIQFCRIPQALEGIERHFRSHDPAVVRAGLFLGLHRGQLACPEMKEQPWYLGTVFRANRVQVRFRWVSS